MTEKVITVGPETLMTKVQEIFKMHLIHHIPVVDDEHKILGMISKHDYFMLLDHLTKFGSKRTDLINEKFLSSLMAGDIMTKNVATIRVGDSVELVIRTFLENEFHALPVIDKGKLVGIITTHDLLKYLCQKEMQQFINP